jgi:hypothetical protein
MTEDHNKDGRRICSIVEGGSANFGQVVLFTFEFADGNEEAFHCNHHDMSNIVHYLTQFSAQAERTRKTLPGQDIEVVTPLVVAGTEVAPASDQQSMAIRFATADGYPVVVAMQIHQAELLADQLRTELAKVGSSYDPRS